MRSGTTIQLVLAIFLSLCALECSSSSVAEAQVRSELVNRILRHNNEGVALLDQYKFKEAAQEFLEVLSYDESVLPARVNLGIAYFYDQQYDEAVATFLKVLQTQPDEIHTHYVLGLIYRNQDEVDKAITAFRNVGAQDPRDSSTNYYLGRLSMRQRDYATATRYFKAVIDEEPYNASAHYNLATALSRSGDREAGREEMNEFRRLQNLFGSTTVGLQYLEQGQYAIAIDRIPDKYLRGYKSKESGPIEVTFVEVAAEAGLDFTHSGPGAFDLRVRSAGELENKAVPFTGSGVSVTDFDQDGWFDLYFSNAGAGGARGTLFRNKGNGSFEDVTLSAGLSYTGKTMHGFWGDYDNDGNPDLYLVNFGANVLYHNEGNGKFEDVTQIAGVGDASWSLGGGFVDCDHDGDLDIYVANFVSAAEATFPRSIPDDFPGAKDRLYRNNGDGIFKDISDETGLAESAARTTAVVTADLDNSRDVDFYLIHWGSRNTLLNNMRDGTFREAANSSMAGLGNGTGVAAGDVNQSGLIDLMLPSMEPGRTRLLYNRGNDRYEEADMAILPPSFGKIPILSTQFLDFDNDGDLDILAVSGPLFEKGPGLSREQNLFLFRKTGDRFEDVSGPAGLKTMKGQAVRGVSVVDFDNDGDLDFVLNVNGGRARLYRNDGGNRNNWLDVRLVGSNSNRSAIGVKAEIMAEKHWQKLESSGGQGFLSQNTPIFHFGLGKYERADIVRLLWPNGVLQSEIDHPANQTIEISELDRKGTSCPILYTWNGEGYQFQTDFLGGSAYGSQLAPGVYNYPDTDEYIKLNRDDVALKEGQLAITMNNQLEEVILFDQLELVVVDHPDDYDIFPDEKLLPGPPYQDFRLISASSPRLPHAAMDGKGRDLLSKISSVDREYPPVPETLPFKGYADLHEIVLDLGQVADDYLVLLMYAWIDYADSTSNLAASQAGLKLVPPYLQVKDEEDNWVTVIERMGFPAGLPKTMTVDLSGKFLSKSRQLRIVTNMKIFWDQILFESGLPRDDFILHRLRPSEAKLRYKGFPEFYTPDGLLPKVYDYNKTVSANWKVHVGAYTRFGDVLPLLDCKDDRFVITRSGDEIEALFPVSSLPPVARGWKRDYLVYVDGFGKDMDPNSAAPQFLGPLPFHGMSSFPYPPSETYLKSKDYERYLEIWNTRIVERSVPDLRKLVKRN